MQRVFSRLAILAVASGLVVFATVAEAAPVGKCAAAKKKCIGKYVAAVLGCHAKAEGKGVALDPACVAKAVAKITGAGKGCFDKNDAKVPNDCTDSNDAAQQLADADAFILDVVTAVDPDYPAPTLTKCGAARKKCVGKKAAGLMGCSAKLNKDGVGDPACAPKIVDKFGGVKGCDPNALVKGTDCLGSATTATLGAKVDAWAATAEAIFDYVGPDCGNGVIDPGELCDPAAPERPEATCGSDFACNPTTCNCACPTSVHFLGDPTSPATLLDVGWTGIAHGTPVVSNGDVTVGLSGCAAERPCGVCAMNGPIPNAGATEIHNRRCTNDTSIRCTDDTPCLGGGGTCEYYFGTTLPLSAGGVTTCALNQFNGPITGTVNVETGDAATTALVTSRVYVGIAIDSPCPVCVGDPTINDDLQGGTCAGGARDTLACDANGTVPARPDFGSRSLDCPPNPGALIATLPIDLSGGTATAAKALSADSPLCGVAAPGEVCLCHTCNNGNAEPCDANADCPDPAGPIGPICGGRRCLGGPNAGAACAANSECPGGGICNRPGEPPKPDACLEDTGSPDDADCVDGDGDGAGECFNGPIISTCTAPHAQRGCFGDGDCTPGTCESTARRCFSSGGGVPTDPGIGEVRAIGAADVPVHDTASPTLASVFCVAPTGSASVNNVAGLPGPGRLTLQGTATARP